MLFFDQPMVKPVHTLAFSPDGATLASVCGRSQHIQLWDLSKREVGSTLHGHTKRVVAVAFASSGETMATVTSTGALWLWTRQPSGGWRATRTIELTVDGWPHGDGRLAFSPDGKLLATTLGHEEWNGRVGRRGTSDGTLPVTMVETATGRVRLRPPEWLGHQTSCLTFSPDGATLATGGFDRTVRLFPMPSGPRQILQQGKKVHYLAFSPDGTTLTSGSPNGMVRVWSATGDLKATFHHKPPALHAICYSPDGRTIATAGGDLEGTVRFWDVASASCVSAMDWQIGELHAVAFSPDGMRAAAGGMGKVVVWDIDMWSQ